MMNTVTIDLETYNSMTNELKQLSQGLIAVNVQVRLLGRSRYCDRLNVGEVSNDELSDYVSKIIIDDHKNAMDTINNLNNIIDKLEKDLSEIKNGNLIGKIKFLFSK